jgi:oligopeptide/dipeptide ABC transporter ATP-binding protein
MTEVILEVRSLRVEIGEGDAVVTPVDDVSFAITPGETLGLVGESGSGKSMTLRALLGLLPPGGRVANGELLFRSADGTLRKYSPEEIRGREISMVFQEPMAALNPVMRVGTLLAEAQRAHGGGSDGVRARSLELLREVGMPDPQRQMRAHPHELSGGLRQRVMIAMALATDCAVLLCDEPTTALDVTIQDQVLRLIDRLRRVHNMAVVFVTHDLAVIGQMCDRVAVLYAGRVVESGPVADVFTSPAHPYTLGLIRSVPELERRTNGLESIGGQPPDPRAFPSGCRFHPRCFMAQSDCVSCSHVQLDAGKGRATACIHHGELPSAGSGAVE